MNKELSKFKKEMREAFADFYCYSDHDCRGDYFYNEFLKARDRVGKLLNVKYTKKGGYHFDRYRKLKK